MWKIIDVGGKLDDLYGYSGCSYIAKNFGHSFYIYCKNNHMLFH